MIFADDPTIEIIDQCIKKLFQQRTFPTVELISSLSGLPVQTIKDAILSDVNRSAKPQTGAKGKFGPILMRHEENMREIIGAEKLNDEAIDNWLGDRYVWKLEYVYTYMKKPDGQDKLESFCEKYNHTVDELYALINKYHLRNRILRNAIIEYYNRKEREAEDYVLDNEGTVTATDLQVVFSEDELSGKLNSIQVSKKLVENNVFTISHTYKFEIEIRRNKDERFGKEIPNASERVLAHLDENGIAKVGEYLVEGDIVIGRYNVLEEPTNYEDKLLVAIFGRKHVCYQDRSIYVPKNICGIVTDVKVKSRKNGDYLKSGIEKIITVYLRQEYPLQIGDILIDSNGQQGIVTGVFKAEKSHGDIIVNFPFDGACITRNTFVQGEMQSRGTGSYSYAGKPLGTSYFTMPQSLTCNEIIKLTKAGLFSVLQDMLICNDRQERLDAYSAVLQREGSHNKHNICFNDNLRRLLYYTESLGGEIVLHSEEDSCTNVESLIRNDWNFDGDNQNGFNAVINKNLCLAISPLEKCFRSHGEVTKSETFNYRTKEPERDGLFCERIFGTTKSYRCVCGKYWGTEFERETCPKCGVKIESSQCREYKCGHIEIPINYPNPIFSNYEINQILVTPPKMRPMYELGNGQWVSADINEIYRKILNRNNRIKRMYESPKHEEVINNEIEMLKEVIQELYEGDLTYEGLFSELYDWLYKSVFDNKLDYSAAARTIVNTGLPSGKCYIPYKLAVQLYEPILLKLIEDKKLAYNIKAALRYLHNEDNKQTIINLFNISTCNYNIIAFSPADGEVVLLTTILTDKNVVELSLNDWGRLKMRTGDKVKLLLPITKYAQEVLANPISLDETLVKEFEQFLKSFVEKQDVSPNEKKQYVLQAINRINEDSNFVNSLMFCFLSWRRATESERRTCVEEAEQRIDMGKIAKLKKVPPVITEDKDNAVKDDIEDDIDIDIGIFNDDKDDINLFGDNDDTNDDFTDDEDEDIDDNLKLFDDEQ